MKKISKNYRFPEKIISTLDSRDKVQYPTETDYVAHAILKLEGGDQESDILKKLNEIEKKLDLILKNNISVSDFENHDFIDFNNSEVVR